MQNRKHILAALFDGDHVAGAHLVRGNIDLLGIDEHMTVVDELPGLWPRASKPGAVYDIIETAFEDAKQVCARNAGLAVRLLVVTPKLFLEDAVYVAELLLLAELNLVLGFADPPAAVVPGGYGRRSKYLALFSSRSWRARRLRLVRGPV